ncbi:MAG: hypothetical protein FWF15_09560 [Oscillospiraceae bacterium]|nr:hypothetical protein [Oscillospiraceae bacterium]
MYEIKSVQSKDQQEKICDQCGIVYDIDTMAYAVYEDDILIGAAQFNIKGQAGYICDLKCSNDEAVFLLERTVISFLELCGIKDVYLKNDGGKLYVNVKPICRH